ncbi:MAG: hypothetical protein EBU51_07585, partial [Synechococcaceae bacterium WB6_3A_227]|nr:hypothetical protein [Synechococcaceae bacterium WB6_3A_227]
RQATHRRLAFRRRHWIPARFRRSQQRRGCFRRAGQSGRHLCPPGQHRGIHESLSPSQVQSLLYNQAELLAKSYRSQIGNGALGRRLEKLVELRRREGYVADCEAEPGGPNWMLQEYHCSVSRVAEAFPVICDQELQLMRKTFPDCAVERVHWKLEGGHACGFRLQPLT